MKLFQMASHRNEFIADLLSLIELCRWGNPQIIFTAPFHRFVAKYGPESLSSQWRNGADNFLGQTFVKYVFSLRGATQRTLHDAIAEFRRKVKKQSQRSARRRTHRRHQARFANLSTDYITIIKACQTCCDALNALPKHPFCDAILASDSKRALEVLQSMSDDTSLTLPNPELFIEDSPALLVCKHPSLKVIKALIRKGIDFSILQDPQGRHALTHIAVHPDKEILWFLLRYYRIDLNEPLGDEQSTLLMTACRCCDETLLALLVRSQVDLTPLRQLDLSTKMIQVLLVVAKEFVDPQINPRHIQLAPWDAEHLAPYVPETVDAQLNLLNNFSLDF